MKRKHGLLLTTLCIIIGNLIFVYPTLDYSPIPSQWGVGSGYGRIYTINTGQIFSPETSLTWQSSIKNYASLDVLPKILAAMISILTGNTGLIESEKFHHVFPWVGILFLPICLLYFYEFLAKKNKGINTVDMLILYLFAMFPLASTLPSMSLGAAAANSVARVLFLLILILLAIIFDQNKSNCSKVAVFILILFPFFYYHHTWSYYMLIYLSLLGIISLVTKERNTSSEKSILGISLLGVVLFFNSALYFNVNLLDESLRIIRNFPQILNNFPSVTYTTKLNSELLGYETLNSTYSYLQLLSSTIILIIFILYIFGYIKNLKRGEPQRYEKVLFYYTIVQLFIFLALFIWDGFLGVYSRFFESLVYLTMLFSAYLLVKSDGKFKSIIRFFLLFAVFVAVFSFLIAPSELNMQLTDEEFVGIQFAGENIPNRSYIFSDFRLATPLIYFNQLGVSTIDSPHDLPEVTEQILIRCYYDISYPEYILDKVINSTKYYVITSSRQSEVFIRDSSLKAFKKAPANFQRSWDEQRAFINIYSSNEIEIFARV